MKKKRVYEILSEQTKRRRKIAVFLFFIFVCFFLGVYLLLSFFNLNKTYYVGYTEDSDLDYKVFLKENSYFKEPFLEKDGEYISSLIDYIDADFDYTIKMNEDISNYKYTYKIVADVSVKGKNSDNYIYREEEVLVEKDTFYANNQEKVLIHEDVIIDYNKYNDLITNFVTTYKLDDVVSNLSLSMYVNVDGSCLDYEEESSSESVIKLDIPLTGNTLSIDLNYDLVDNVDGVIACKEDNQYAFLALVISILFFVGGVYLVVSLIKFIYSTRTAEGIYSRELKKILNGYSSYIQKINNNFDMTGYQVLKVDTFNDMLEIRDTIQEPILMVENEEKSGTYFLIPSKTRVLYSYRLKVSDIKEKLDEEMEVNN